MLTRTEPVLVRACGQRGFVSRITTLLRVHTLTGWALLVIPCMWGHVRVMSLEEGYPLMMMGIAAFWARSLGCLYNDWVDRSIDAKVTRTRMRPLARGTTPNKELIGISVVWGFLGISFLGIFPLSVIILGAGGLLGSLVYPFLKRVWGYPQLFLGCLFNLGIFGSALWLGRGGKEYFVLIALYIQGVLWTVEYDTVYACQDYEDDKKQGVLSLPVTLGRDCLKLLIFKSMMARYMILSGVCGVSVKILGWLAVVECLELLLLDTKSSASCGAYFKRSPLKGLALTAILL